MAKAKDVLAADDYSNYRNVRAISLLFILLWGLLLLGAFVLFSVKETRQKEPVSPVAPIVCLVAGVAGLVGGFAARFGNRQLAPLVYVMAALYIFAFPIGTILSFVMFKGLSRYLNSVDQVRAAG